MEKRPRGRPEKPESERKKRMIAFRVEDDERDQLEQAAELSGVRLSEWIRAKLLSAARREIKKGGERGNRTHP